MKTILALDPGSDKCGFALLRYDLTVLEKGVVALSELHRSVRRLCQPPGPEAIVLGLGTASAVVSRLINDLQVGVPVRFSDERDTTREARIRYFRENPPRGFWRLVPVGLQIPPCPVDDHAACIIGERYLRTHRLVVELAPRAA